MSEYTTTMSCSNCGGAIHPSHEKCGFCESPIYIKYKSEPSTLIDTDALEFRYMCEAGRQVRNPNTFIIIG